MQANINESFKTSKADARKLSKSFAQERDVGCGMWNCGLRIRDCWLRIGDWDFRLPIADCACLTAIAGRDCGLRIVDCWLGIMVVIVDQWTRNTSILSILSISSISSIPSDLESLESLETWNVKRETCCFVVSPRNDRETWNKEPETKYLFIPLSENSNTIHRYFTT